MTKPLIYCLAASLLMMLFSAPAFPFGDQTIDLNVKKGDFLLNICRNILADRHQCPQVTKINELRDPDRILPGQTLKIPVKLLKGVPMDAIVTFIKGDVMVRRTEVDQWIPLQLNERVTEGSGIRTGPYSTVELTFEDDSTLFQKPDTTIEVSVSKRSLSYIIREIFLSAGRVITKLRSATGQEKRFDIRTPSAIAAARGTEFRTSVDTDDNTRSEVIKGAVDVEAQNVTVRVIEGEGTIVRRGQIPAQPKNLLPAPEPSEIETLYRSLPFGLHFTPIEGASSYRFVLSRDEAGKDIVREEMIKTSLVWEITAIDDGVYYLHSASLDSEGIEGLPHEPITIRVRTNPIPPFINFPVNGAELRQSSVTLKWLKVADAVGYHLQISRKPDFQVLLDDKKTGDTQHTAPFEYGSYFFRLASLAPDGYEGVWSDASQFILLPPPPSPSLEAPALDKNALTIRWRSVGPGVTYHFQMSHDQEFKTVLDDEKVDAHEIVLRKPDNPGIYYVRTSSIDLKGYEGSFSLPQSFEIKRSFPYYILGIVGAVALLIIAI